MQNIEIIKQQTEQITRITLTLHSLSRAEFERVMNIECSDDKTSGIITLYLNGMELVRETAQEIRMLCEDIQARMKLLEQNPLGKDCNNG